MENIIFCAEKIINSNFFNVHENCQFYGLHIHIHNGQTHQNNLSGLSMIKEEVFCSVFFGIAVKYGEIGAREVTEKVVFGPVLRSALHEILCKYYMLLT